MYRCPEIASLFLVMLQNFLVVACNSPEDSRKRVQRRLVAGSLDRQWAVPRGSADSLFLFPSDPCLRETLLVPIDR